MPVVIPALGGWSRRIVGHFYLGYRVGSVSRNKQEGRFTRVTT